MKCIILLLAFTALCYSYPYGNTGGRSVHISEDGTIIITGQNGKRVTITKETGIAGRKNMEIAISGPNIPTKKIQINEQNELRGNLFEGTRGQEGEFDISDEYQRDKRSSKKRSQGDTLLEILREYQGGIVDDVAYEQLLKKVSTAVQSGLLSESVYDVLQGLRQTQYPGVGQVITGQDVNVLDLLQRQQQVEKILQQQYQQKVQGGPFRVFGQQQIPQLYGQGISGNKLYGAEGNIGTLQGMVWDVPVQGSQGQILEKMLLAQPQGISSPLTEGLIYGQKGIGVGSYARIPSFRGLQGSIWDDLLSNNLIAQQRGISTGQYGQIPLLQIVENEKAILDQQSVIQQQQVQQQQLQQQQQQQILQQQEQQWQLLQQLEQLQEQQQLQQEQLQQQVWQPQVQQYNPLSTYQQLLNRPVSRTQQGGLWQQLVNAQGKLVRVPNWQGVPVVTPNIVPLVY